jgi:hypothetical protein
VLDLTVVLDHVVKARSDQPADQRREGHLVGEVGRLVQLAQAAIDDRSGGDEAAREDDPECLERQTEDVDVGLHYAGD